MVNDHTVDCFRWAELKSGAEQPSKTGEPAGEPRRRDAANRRRSDVTDTSHQAAGSGGRALSPDLLERMNAYWRAANYLSVGQIYLRDNPLLRRPLRREDVKARLLGHWGTCPGLNLVYVHLNRAIKARDLNVVYICGPGHGGPAMVANVYLEGTYSEYYSRVSPDEEGMQRLFKQFSFPGGIPSHVAAETPGSINEGGELGYCLSHAYGAAFDNPDLLVAASSATGRPRPGALAAAWHSNKFLNPAVDGAVLPILHLNGYKIANPTVLARIAARGVGEFLRGCGYTPLLRRGRRPAHGAPAHGRHAGHGARRDQGDPAAGPGRGRHRAPGLAGHRAGDAQGLDRSQDGRRASRPRAPSARTRCPSPT